MLEYVGKRASPLLNSDFNRFYLGFMINGQFCCAQALASFLVSAGLFVVREIHNDGIRLGSRFSFSAVSAF